MNNELLEKYVALNAFKIYVRVPAQLLGFVNIHYRFQ